MEILQHVVFIWRPTEKVSVLVLRQRSCLVWSFKTKKKTWFNGTALLTANLTLIDAGCDLRPQNHEHQKFCNYFSPRKKLWKFSKFTSFRNIHKLNWFSGYCQSCSWSQDWAHRGVQVLFLTYRLRCQSLGLDLEIRWQGLGIELQFFAVRSSKWNCPKSTTVEIPCD